VTVTVAASTEKTITAFDLLSADNPVPSNVTGTVDQTAHTVALVVPFGTNVTALKPSITFAGKSVSPADGVATDFTDPVDYTVTAGDNSGQTYTVTVTFADYVSDAKEILQFTIDGFPGTFNGTTILVMMPFGTDRAHLTPTIFHTGASISPASGVEKDFTNPVTYTVTADDGSTKAYTVVVSVAADASKAITGFRFLAVDNGVLPADVVGVVDQADHAIALVVPYGTNVTALTPTISFAGDSVSPPSGVAADFTDPVQYEVTAGDNSAQTYTVTVTFADYVSDAKDILSFSMEGTNGTFVGTAISVTVPYGTNVTALAPTIFHTGASVSPASGAAQNFTNPVTYTVTADDGSTKTYTVTVTVAANSDKRITAFVFLASNNAGLAADAAGTITEADHAIALEVPHGTVVTALKPTVSFSGDSVSPASGAAQNFTNPVDYAVTAGDNSAQTYTVTVTIAAHVSDAKDIIQFSVAGTNGAFSGTNIAVTVPHGTDVAHLTPTVDHTGASISPASGVEKDFTNPVTYTVTADDGSTKTYTVTVTVASSSAKTINSFAFLATNNPGLSADVVGTINQTAHTIALEVPAGTNATALRPTIAFAGTSVVPASEVARNFLDPVTYWVNADDGSAQAYDVTVTFAEALSDAKDILSFSVAGANGTNSGTAIAVTVPYGTNVTALTPTIAISGASVSPASGAAQNFTNPVTYTVTAEDGSTKTYTVTVTVAPGDTAVMTSFAFLHADNAGLAADAAGVIDQTNHTVAVAVPAGTVVTALKPTIAIDGASVDPASGTAQDFTNTVDYWVNAADGSAQKYEVTVTVGQ